MKRILSIFVSALLCCGSVFAQDARGRVPVTIVNDVLAATPSADAAAQWQNAADLAISAPQTVELLCERLAPAEERKNALAEYAISSVVAYVSDPANAAYKGAVREGLRKGAVAQADAVNRNFILAQLRLIATADDVAFFEGYADDELAAATAVSALETLPGGDKALLRLIEQGAADKSLLAAAAANIGLTAAEPVLLAWAANAEGAGKAVLCQSLGVIGSEASASFLKANSKADYAVLLNNLPAKKAVAGAKSLMKEDASDLRCAGIEVFISKSSEKDGLKALANALKSDDRPYRNTALAAATEAYGPDAVAAVVSKNFYNVSGHAQTDLVNWIGANGAADLLPLVETAFDGDGVLGLSAVRAAGQIGTPQAADDLIALLGTDRSSEALAALYSFNGNLEEKVYKALISSADKDKTAALLTLAGARQMKSAAPLVLNFAQGLGDVKEFAEGEVQNAALTALPGVVTPDNFDEIAGMLATTDKPENIPALQRALLASTHTESSSVQAARIKGCLIVENKDRFYPVLAATGADEAVATLRELSAADSAAREALLATDNAAVIPDLLAAAREGGPKADGYLDRYMDLLDAYETNDDVKRFGYAEVIYLTASPAIKVKALETLGDMPLMKTFLLAGKSLNDSDPDVRMAAAVAVKKIASKSTEEINYDDLKANLEAARSIFAARGWADDGYAVDEINKMLLEATPSPRSELTPEEVAQGFEMLFDGTDLSKWHGDLEGYTVVNGAIYVSANYGATGNLYTNKEYRNFIYRFEFCFLEEGVNNGVGVRTPEDVDAAYHGMCELQILDHDAPAYDGWLRPYQVHGSIYGVVPAKRIKHKPLGEWSTEEIIVEGDHITVKVNGEVITDADVRKVTKGHNVAPDGGAHNPYTIDGNNHPGMFNYKGHLSFCGHGAGLKIRNVRILDLGYKK